MAKWSDISKILNRIIPGPKSLMETPNIEQYMGLNSFVKTLEPVKKLLTRRSQDGGGIGRGDHFLSYKFIERTTER